MSPDRFEQENRLLGEERLRRKEDALRQRSHADASADQHDAGRRIAAEVRDLTHKRPDYV